MIVALLVIAALSCLIVGIVAGKIVLGYIALGLAVGAGVMLIASTVVKRRAQREPVPEGDEGNDEPAQAESPEQPEEDPTGTPDGNGAPPPDTAESGAAEPTDYDAVPAVTPDGSRPPHADQADTMVHVVPGRKRYHEPGCTVLSGHEHEEITVVEARDEGFTPCTRCVT